MANEHSYLIDPHEGKFLALGGVGMVFKIDGDAVGRAFSIVEEPIEPGRLVPPHTHTREDEITYVLAGEIGVRVGGRDLVATAGSYVIKPRSIPHAYWNATREPARILEIFSPAGFEQYFGELAELLAQGTPPIDTLTRLRSKYGATSQGMEWVPELKAKYGLKLLGEA
ncbi:cupin domain-containing protein [Pendulispora albinea]|uniref:Cupin domain-containing protein n=1 Tax=Pendulispora albinea TaxID=2741071 RepID=A0ABZ2LMS1_9BACT